MDDHMIIDDGIILINEQHILYEYVEEIREKTKLEFLFIKKGNKWYKQSTWYKAFFNETEEIPSDSYTKLWEETMKKAAKDTASVKTKQVPPKRPAESQAASSSSKSAAKKVAKPRNEDKVAASGSKIAPSGSKVATSEDKNATTSGQTGTDKPRELIVIADHSSSELAEELEAKHPELYNKLAVGLKGRQEVMQPKNALKFVYVKPNKPARGGNQTEKAIQAKISFLEKRDNERHKRITNLMSKTIMELENKSREDDAAEARQLKKKFPGPLSGPKNLLLNPHPSTPGTLFNPDHPSCFKIDKLIEFAESKGAVVLNIDRFATASNERVVYFNPQGNCVYCHVHQVESKQPHVNCPYIFCACAQCYVMDKFKR